MFRAFFKAEGLIADEQELDNKVRTLAGEVLFKGDRNRDNSLNEDGKCLVFCQVLTCGKSLFV